MRRCRAGQRISWTHDGRQDLPANARRYVDFIAERTGVSVHHVSVGPGREQFIHLNG